MTVTKQVRFAETNSFFAPPKGFNAMVASRASSTSSSIGPFTPPMYVAGAFGAPQPVPPTHTPSTGMPVAHVNTGPIIHPLLARSPSGDSSPILRYDLVDPPSGSALSLRSKDVIRSLTRALDEPATSSPVTHMTIHCPHLPWSIRVSSTSGTYVTVNDVLVAIYHSLRKQLNHSDYALIRNERDRERAAQAYRDRYRSIHDNRAYEEEKAGGMRRVDFLMERTRFGGLSQGVDAYGREGWTLFVME